MTGSNFKYLNRHDEYLEKLLQELYELRAKYWDAERDTDNVYYFVNLRNLLGKIQKKSG